MANNPYKEYANRIAEYEKAYRERAGALANMSTTAPTIQQQQQVANQINPDEIPAVRALANYQATGAEQSSLRQKAGSRTMKGMPKYVTGYRSYLKWRYPSRYGGGSGSSYYSAQPGNAGFSLSPITNITPPPVPGVTP